MNIEIQIHMYILLFIRDNIIFSLIYITILILLGLSFIIISELLDRVDYIE